MKTVTTTFDFLKENNYPSVTDYCRFLMKLNPERYQDMPVEVYRGEMLCLIGESVKKCAEIQPNGDKFIKYRGIRSRRASKQLAAGVGDV